MKRYAVEVPVAGRAYIEVEANSEEEAIEIAVNKADFSHIEEWDYYRVLIQGNVFRGPISRATAEEIEES